MRVCIIFNPSARGDKARRFRRRLGQFGSDIALKSTQMPGDGRRLAAEAVRDGFDTLVAAGGDGTVNEVVNGIADAPDGFARTRLAVLPLGTVNVFARELGLPLQLRAAWALMLTGRERRLDAPFAEYHALERTQRRYFAQLAGAGLDARAISLVDWRMKKRVSHFAYVLAGMKAMRESHPPITVSADGQTHVGELVLVGNGRLYGGNLPMFPAAKPDDGLIHICVFPRVNWFLLCRYALSYATGRAASLRDTKALRVSHATLTAEASVPFEVDGDLCGMLPMTLGILPGVLRVVA